MNPEQLIEDFRKLDFDEPEHVKFFITELRDYYKEKIDLFENRLQETFKGPEDILTAIEATFAAANTRVQENDIKKVELLIDKVSETKKFVISRRAKTEIEEASYQVPNFFNVLSALYEKQKADTQKITPTPTPTSLTPFNHFYHLTNNFIDKYRNRKSWLIFSLPNADKFIEAQQRLRQLNFELQARQYFLHNQEKSKSISPEIEATHMFKLLRTVADLRDDLKENLHPEEKIFLQELEGSLASQLGIGKLPKSDEAFDSINKEVTQLYVNLPKKQQVGLLKTALLEMCDKYKFEASAKTLKTKLQEIEKTDREREKSDPDKVFTDINKLIEETKKELEQSQDKVLLPALQRITQIYLEYPKSISAEPEKAERFEFK